MPEPFTLAVVGTIALTEGIKFLYGQCGEVLKRWRDRRDKAAKEEVAGNANAAPSEVERPKTAEPVSVELPAVFEGRLSSPEIHFDAVEKLEEPLRELRKELSSYADGTDPVDASDEKLLRNVDALRQALEAVYQQRLTFKGEQRPASGPVVEGRIDVENVRGYVAGVRAKAIYSGNVRANAKATNVETGAEFIGVDAETIGYPPDAK